MAMKKTPKWAIVVSIVAPITVVVSALLDIGLLFIAFKLNVGKMDSIYYLDDLEDYTLQKIVGSVSMSNNEYYHEQLNECSSKIDELWSIDIFPTNIPIKNNLFLYDELVEFDNLEYNRIEFYLECVWSDDEYNAEKSRLESIQNRGNKPLFSNDLFPLPSLIYKYNFNAEYEYVLFNESEHIIYYIWLDEIGSLDSIVFDDELVPKKRLRDSDLKGKTKGWSFSYSI